MKIQTFIVGRLSTNCYIVSCLESAEAIIIDPGFKAAFEAEQITCYLEENSLKPMFIVNTHGHSDHISGDEILKRKYSVPVCIHEYDANCLTSLVKHLSPTNVLFKDGSLLEFGRVALQVMHTPGHTLGSISLVGSHLVFTGDTLFAGGIGRTDFPGGSDRDMRTSLQRLICLPNNYVIYPGHGCLSTIGREKQVNSFLLWL